MSCWQTLGIAPTSDEAVIKKAYAARIREHRPDRDPEGFRRVRTAYEAALASCAFARPPAEPPPAPSGDVQTANTDAYRQISQSGYDGYTATLPPEIRETLREPENVAYLDRPAARERATAPHDYLDRPADAQESPAALLARLQAAWEDATSDAALLAELQAQAATVATQSLDFRLDYTRALQQLLNNDDYPRSRQWAQAHYALVPHSGPHYLNDLIRNFRDPAMRDTLLARHYPALAAWLQLSPLRRWWQLRRDWLLRHNSGLVWQDWQRLRFASGDLPAPHYRACWPPLAALQRNPNPLALPWPWLLAWFVIATIAAFILQSRLQYQALFGFAPITVLIVIIWLALTACHILLRAKCAITLAWIPPPVPRKFVWGFAIACLLFGCLPEGGHTLTRTLALLCGQLAVICYWLRLPADAPARRSDFLNNGAVSIVVSLALYFGSETFNQNCAPFLNLLYLLAFTLRYRRLQSPQRGFGFCLQRMAATLAQFVLYLFFLVGWAQLVLFLGGDGGILRYLGAIALLFALIVFHYAS